jgi:hypothetical protein
MPLPQDRYFIYDPHSHAFIPALDMPDGIFTSSTRAEALLIAGFEAQARGHDVLVGDRMAHHGCTVLWRVSPTGGVFPQQQSP